MVIFGARGEQRDEKMDLIKKNKTLHMEHFYLQDVQQTVINSGDRGRRQPPSDQRSSSPAALRSVGGASSSELL